MLLMVGVSLVVGSFLISNAVVGSIVSLIGVIITAIAIFRKI